MGFTINPFGQFGAGAPGGSQPMGWFTAFGRPITNRPAARLPFFTVQLRAMLWTPANLGATLLAWYKGDLLSGSNNDPISTWTDSSGNGNHATQSGAIRPILATALLNGMNAVRFDYLGGGDTYFDLPNMFSSGSAASAYVVIKCDLDPPTINSASGIWDIGSDSQASHFPFGDSNVYDEFGTDSRKSVGNPTPSLASWRIYGPHSAANDWAAFLDGVSIFSTGTNTVGFTTTPRLGGYPPTGMNLDGWMAEVVFTNAKQSSGDREKVEGYLAYKWGLQGNLDAGHPYKSTPPYT